MSYDSGQYYAIIAAVLYTLQWV